jgi:hypothetical protein
MTLAKEGVIATSAALFAGTALRAECARCALSAE